jgi:sec-independent protein translocase protein TatB
MFNIGWGEFVLIGIVALVVIGPKELPGVLRMVGEWTGKIRRMASEFQNQFQEAMREAEMAELKKQVDEMSKAATDLPHFDPLETARSEMQRAVEGTPAVPPGTSLETPAEAAATPPAIAAESDPRAAAFSGADVDAAAFATGHVPQAPPAPPVPEPAPHEAAAALPPAEGGGRP